MSEREQGILTFPCEFTFKIIGLANAEFEGEVLRIITQHFPHLGEGAFSQNFSKNGKYLAFTVTIQATSQQQLDDAYRALSNNPAVLFAL